MPLQYIINSEVYLRLFMNQVVSITKSINSYEDVHQRFNLKRTEKEHLFLEWFENIPELTEYEKSTLDKIRQRYIHHRQKGLLTESTVIILVIAPLLELAGFYDPPFMIKAEESLEIELENQEEILRRLIDVLVVKDKLWILIPTFCTSVCHIKSSMKKHGFLGINTCHFLVCLRLQLKKLA